MNELLKQQELRQAREAAVVRINTGARPFFRFPGLVGRGLLQLDERREFDRRVGYAFRIVAEGPLSLDDALRLLPEQAS